jgi:hypothetical protein
MADETKDKKETTASLTDQERAAKIIKQRDSIQRGRQLYEKQWLINIAFLHGKQHFQIEKKPTDALDERVHWELQNLERQKKTRRVDNYILPLYRSLLSRMLSMKSHITVDPTTNSERDKSAARVGSEALEEFWQNVNKHNPILCQQYSGMMLILAKLFGYDLAVGTAYLKPYFNPKAKSKAYLNNEVIEGEIGEVETKVLHTLDVFEDPMHKYIIEQSIMDVEDIEAQYDVKVEPEDVGLSDTEQRLINILEGSKPEKFENAARVLEKWSLPTKAYSKGRYEICTAKKIIYDGELPPEYKGRLPYFKFTYLDLMLSSFCQGMVEQLISHQEELNNTVSRLAAYKKWLAGKVMVPKGAELETKWDDEVGQLIFYATGNKPTYESGGAPPNFLLMEIARIKKSMEDIAVAHDASMGRIPNQAKSGVAIENLAEADNSVLSPILMGIEQQLSFFAETVLDIMEAKYTEPRLLAITGEMLGADVKTFKNDSIMGNKRIRISLGSSLPYSRGERQRFIMDLEVKGYITKEKARELMEFGDLDGIFHSMDETLQKEEIQMMLKDNTEVVVEEWDDHTIHLKVMTDFMKTPQFMQLEQPIKQKFLEHRKAHQDMLLKEEQAKASMEVKARMAAMPQPQPMLPPPAGGPA